VQQISEELESKEKGLQQAQDEYAEAAGRSDVSHVSLPFYVLHLR
jgi:hypothetical protein